MKLVVDHSLAAGQVRVQCLKCSALVQLAEALIDRDGPAFLAYYHKGCIEGRHAKCTIWDCARDHTREAS